MDISWDYETNLDIPELKSANARRRRTSVQKAQLNAIAESDFFMRASCTELWARRYF